MAQGMVPLARKPDRAQTRQDVVVAAGLVVSSFPGGADEPVVIRRKAQRRNQPTVYSLTDRKAIHWVEHLRSASVQQQGDAIVLPATSIFRRLWGARYRRWLVVAES